MILKYIGKDEDEFIKNKEYFAFEIYIIKKNKKVKYYVLNDMNKIEIYDAIDFEIINNSLDNMVLIISSSKNKIIERITGLVGKKKHIIRIKQLEEINKSFKSKKGIWKAYRKGDKKVIEKVHEIIIRQAKNEGYIINSIETT